MKNDDDRERPIIWETSTTVFHHREWAWSANSSSSKQELILKRRLCLIALRRVTEASQSEEQQN